MLESMDRKNVPETWIGQKVVLIPLDQDGASMQELYGWLRDVSAEGITFSKEFYSNILNGQRLRSPNFMRGSA
jgi:hypothetical protein